MTKTPDYTTHALERTSPKGELFVGRCTRCGATDLPPSAALDECPAEPTDFESEIVRAVLGEDAR